MNQRQRILEINRQTAETRRLLRQGYTGEQRGEIDEDTEVRGFPNRSECPSCPHGRFVHFAGGCWPCWGRELPCPITWKEIA